MIKCDYCEREFKTIYGVNAHCGVQHKEELLNRKIKVSNGKEYETVNITFKELETLRSEHDQKCDICGKEETAKTNRKSSKPNLLSIDHDHTTKNFRGFLCLQCNRSLGWYEKYSKQIEDYLR